MAAPSTPSTARRAASRSTDREASSFWLTTIGVLTTGLAVLFWLPVGRLDSQTGPAGGRGVGQGRNVGTEADRRHPDPCVRARAMVADAGRREGWIPVAGPGQHPQALRRRGETLEIWSGPGGQVMRRALHDVVNSDASPSDGFQQRVTLTLEWAGGGAEQWLSCAAPDHPQDQQALTRLWLDVVAIQEQQPMRVGLR